MLTELKNDQTNFEKLAILTPENSYIFLEHFLT